MIYSSEYFIPSSFHDHRLSYPLEKENHRLKSVTKEGIIDGSQECIKSMKVVIAGDFFSS